MAIGRTVLVASLVACVLASLALTACKREDDSAASGPQSVRDLPQLRAIERSEHVLLALTPRLKLLGDSVLDLRLPSHASRQLFEGSVTYRDLGREPPHKLRHLESVDTHLEEWSVAETEATSELDALRLWSVMFERVDHFERAKFKFVKGELVGERDDMWVCELLFVGVARRADGTLTSFEAHADVTWTRGESRPITGPTLERSPVDPSQWRITQWNTRDFREVRSSQTTFDDVTARVLPSAADRELASASPHEVALSAFLKTGERPGEFFRVYSTGDHPSVVVVDIDRDGDDDLFVTRRRGRCLLFENQGDGTFREAAASRGLDIEGNFTCSLFADFDNDGDDDVMLGSFYERSQFLRNTGGQFEVDESVLGDAQQLPGMVTSLAAADFDGDGLLDLYASTYQPTSIMGSLKPRPEKRAALERLFSKSEVDTMIRLNQGPDAVRTRNVFGPPNRLLRNTGEGRFALVQSDVMEVYRNTFQAAWADYDGDGDADLYLANDFAPNNLIRNDGNGRFVDVTAETDTADVGFGMGASWGDYDFDGREDIYVTNMYSKAGIRILGRLEGLVDDGYKKYVRGNSLLRNGTNSFSKVSGLKEPSLLVEKAGWSWGGQFFDFDNDGDLDIYALSGMYTAPADVAIPFDN